jgi:hypothetical protein
MLTVGCRPDWAGVCAFSPTSRITQRDGTTERDAPDNCTLLYPGDPGPRRPLHREVHGRPAAGRTPACSMIPGWRPPPGPGSPGVRSHAGGSPAIPEPGPRARRHPGVPAGLPFTRCAVTLDQLHRKGDGPRAAGTTDGGRQRTTAIQEDPVDGTRVRRPAYASVVLWAFPTSPSSPSTRVIPSRPSDSSLSGSVTARPRRGGTWPITRNRTARALSPRTVPMSSVTSRSYGNPITTDSGAAAFRWFTRSRWPARSCGWVCRSNTRLSG